MPRISCIFARAFTIMLLAGASSGAARAGMTQDLRSCTAAEGRASAAACTRVMNSGRLPAEQFYIGHFNRAASYQMAGDFEKALADLDKVVRLAPRFARGHHARGLVQDSLGATDKARADLDRAIELAPKEWSTYVSRAALLREQQDLDGALADLRKAASLDPSQDKVRLYRALILSDKGDDAAARAEINEVISRGRATADGYYARAAVAIAEQRLDAAEADLARALDERKDFAAARVLMGRIAEDRGNAGKAEGHYEAALAAAPNTFDARPAQKAARQRLSALSGTNAAKTGGARADAPSVALRQAPREEDCKRFLPATGTIISADCDE